MIRMVLVALLLAAPAAAQTWPQPPRYFGITGSPADPLEIRAAPDASAELLGTIPAGTTPIEIGATDETEAWGRIVFHEFEGWAPMASLTEIEVPLMAGTALPVGLGCFGTEPFWGLSLDSPEAVIYSSFEGEDMSFPVTLITGASGRRGLPAAIEASGGETALTATIATAFCSDGMSEATYPLAISLLIRTPGETSFYEGCCTLQIRP